MIIERRKIGHLYRPYIIAEIAQTHDGSLGNALSFIKIAKDCGADAIKFQTHIASEESTPGEPWRIQFSKQDETRFDYWRRMEFTFEQWCIIKEHCEAVGITFLSSPFSIKACEWLYALGMPAWKIASGEVHNSQMLEWITARKQPVILSSGLSLIEESRSALRIMQANNVDVALLHCTTKYPTPAEEVGLNILEDFIAEFPTVPIGLSDHSGTTTPGIIASYLGAAIIEVHLTMHSNMFGPDVTSSLTPDMLSTLVRASEMAWRMRSHRVNKTYQLDSLGNERRLFGRSLYTTRKIKSGEVVELDSLGFKKPGGGLDYEQRHLVVGRRAKYSLGNDHMIKAEDVE